MEAMRLKRYVQGIGKKAAAVACAAVLASPAWAIDPAAGTGGASFTKIGIGSARALSLGRAYVALAEGTDALTWNPAGIAVSQQRELQYSYLRYVQGIDAPLYAAYVHPIGRTVVGANIAYLAVDGFDVRDANGVPINSSDVRVQDGFGSLSVARSFWFEKVFLGASIKAIHEDNDGTIRDVVVGDLGLLFKPNPYVTFGLASQNFGAPTRRVAQINRGGAAVRLFELLNLSLEVNKPSDNRVRIGLGAEFMLPEDLLQLGQVFLRVGYHNADNVGRVLEEDRSFLFPLIGSPKLSFGIGIFTAQAFGYGISFDYSLISLGALGTADMLSLKMRF